MQVDLQIWRYWQVNDFLEKELILIIDTDRTHFQHRATYHWKGLNE